MTDPEQRAAPGPRSGAGGGDPSTTPPSPGRPRLKRRLVLLLVTLVLSFMIPHLLSLPREDEGPRLAALLLAIGGGVLVLAGGLLAMRYAISPDIDALERTHDELARSRRDAAATEETLRHLREASHEIRASLDAVLGLTQLVLHGPLDATQLRRLRTIEGASRALARTVGDLLSLAAPERTARDVVLLGASLHDVLRVSVDLLEPAARDQGLGLSLSVAPDLPDRVLLDAGRVQQMVLAACRHVMSGRERGRVHLEARAENAGTDRFELSLSVTLRRDDSAEDEPPPRSAPQGAGDLPSSPSSEAAPGEAAPRSASLSLARQTVALLGGELRAGADAALELWLPVQRIGPGAARPSQPPPPPVVRLPTARAPLLVVEADPAQQAAAVELLDSLGFDVETADDAAAALERAERDPFALILIATELPGLDGYAAAARLVTRLGPQRPAIIGCTTEPLAAVRARGAAAGLDALLEKPLSRDALSGLLAEWLPDDSHPTSSGERLSQAGALAQATRRALTTALAQTPPGALPDLVHDDRSARRLGPLLRHAPAALAGLGEAAARAWRERVAELAAALHERCAEAGAVKMAGLCRVLAGARGLSFEQIAETLAALRAALEALEAHAAAAGTGGEPPPPRAGSPDTPHDGGDPPRSRPAPSR